MHICTKNCFSHITVQKCKAKNSLHWYIISSR